MALFGGHAHPLECFRLVFRHTLAGGRQQPELVLGLRVPGLGGDTVLGRGFGLFVVRQGLVAAFIGNIVFHGCL